MKRRLTVLSDFKHISQGGHSSTRHTESDILCMCLYGKSVDALHKYHLMIYCCVLSLFSGIGKLSLDKPSVIHCIFTALNDFAAPICETKVIIIISP